MKIAICDDEEKFLFELKSKVYEYSNLHNWESVVDTYKSGYQLINASVKYDIIILDYQMDKINGLDTAKELRKGINQFSCIIFLTSYPEIAISAYDVDTYRFVVKSSLYTGLYKALDDFRNISSLDYDINIKVNREHRTINTSDITFIEVQNKLSYVHLSNSEILITKKSLSSFYKEVPHTHFFKTHKSFIINYKYITERSNVSLKIKNYPYEIPISRNYLSEFKNSYLNYLKDCKI